MLFQILKRNGVGKQSALKQICAFSVAILTQVIRSDSGHSLNKLSVKCKQARNMSGDWHIGIHSDELHHWKVTDAFLINFSLHHCADD